MNYLRAIILTIFVYLGLSNLYLSNKVNKLDKELGAARNNVEQYQALANKNLNENRVLQLSVNDFKQSNDSLVQELSKKADSLNIKTKQLERAITSKTLLTDTLVRIIPSKERDFTVELKSNPLTTIKISRVDSVLTCIPEIYNHQDLYIYKEKVWRNRRKNWFQRLIHLDFKKDEIEKYQIINTNELIQVLDTRVISISN